MSLPKVSIVIPSYKAEHFEQCLRSAIGQTYPNTEILVSDNCPLDAIRDICARFPGVIYQRNSVIREANVMSAFFTAKGERRHPAPLLHRAHGRRDAGPAGRRTGVLGQPGD
jgi:cellulose synthase/poly-beta-1,6-N-acetylglucosamine synthase-like glycosyltransferase